MSSEVVKEILLEYEEQGRKIFSYEHKIFLDWKVILDYLST